MGKYNLFVLAFSLSISWCYASSKLEALQSLYQDVKNNLVSFNEDKIVFNYSCNRRIFKKKYKALRDSQNTAKGFYQSSNQRNMMGNGLYATINPKDSSDYASCYGSQLAIITIPQGTIFFDAFNNGPYLNLSSNTKDLLEINYQCLLPKRVDLSSIMKSYGIDCLNMLRDFFRSYKISVVIYQWFDIYKNDDCKIGSGAAVVISNHQLLTHDNVKYLGAVNTADTLLKKFIKKQYGSYGYYNKVIKKISRKAHFRKLSQLSDEEHKKYLVWHDKKLLCR